MLDAVSQLDLTAFYARYREDGWGRKAYEPSMMVALVLYAYCEGERSSRRIEWRCREDIAFRVLTANQQPDHATLRAAARGAPERERIHDTPNMLVRSPIRRGGVASIPPVLSDIEFDARDGHPLELDVVEAVLVSVHDHAQVGRVRRQKCDQLLHGHGRATLPARGWSHIASAWYIGRKTPPRLLHSAGSRSR